MLFQAIPSTSTVTTESARIPAKADAGALSWTVPINRSTEQNATTIRLAGVRYVRYVYVEDERRLHEGTPKKTSKHATRTSKEYFDEPNRPLLSDGPTMSSAHTWNKEVGWVSYPKLENPGLGD